eukprot:2962704-Pleurochrysis_carterae.AAC.1
MRDWAHGRSKFADGLDGGEEKGGSAGSTGRRSTPSRWPRWPTQGKKATQRQEPTATRVQNNARVTTGATAKESWTALNFFDSRGLRNRSPKVWKKTVRFCRNKTIGRQRVVGGPPSKESGGPMPQKALLGSRGNAVRREKTEELDGAGACSREVLWRR